MTETPLRAPLLMLFLISQDYQSSLSIHPLSLPSPHKVDGIYFAELWSDSFFSEQEAPAPCPCLAAAPAGRQVLPRDWVPNPCPSLPRLFFPWSQDRQCQLLWPQQAAIRSRPELHQKPWCPGGSRNAVSSWPQRKTHELYHLWPDYTLFQGITVENISKVSDPIYELV